MTTPDNERLMYGIIDKTKEHLNVFKCSFVLRLGAENGIRTRDPQLGKLMLYQLSYFRKWL